RLAGSKPRNSTGGRRRRRSARPGPGRSRRGTVAMGDRGAGRGEGLHIGIDAREMLGHATGVGRYVTETLRAWSENASLPHRFTLFLPSAPPAGWHPPDPRFDVTVVASEAHGTWWEQTALRRAANAASLNVFFGPAYTVPLGLMCPSVVLIHDVS